MKQQKIEDVEILARTDPTVRAFFELRFQNPEMTERDMLIGLILKLAEEKRVYVSKLTGEFKSLELPSGASVSWTL